jgi:solute carrier family 25 S-adenosylmethionine transporter 26
VWHIASREGIAGGLFAGFGSFLLRDLPFDAIEFTSYEQIKLAWSSVGGHEIKQHESAVVGAVAGMLAGAVTTPLDVVKTRLMTQGGMSGDTRYYKGVTDCVTRTVAEEGWIALLKGIGPRVTFIGLGGGVFFFVWEGAKKALGVDKRSAGSSMTRGDGGGDVRVNS